jgi:DNA repair protein RecO (recombination protein O)
LDWTDHGIVLGTRRHGETNAILEILTRDHGRHLGLVRGGFGPRMRATLQLGNSIRVVWRARLEEHLGYFSVEALALRTATLLATRCALFGVTHLAALSRLLPERDPHPMIYDELVAVLEHMNAPKSLGAEIARFELRLLAELGFGLDLARCVATGRSTDLVFVSPKSGRAVSREAGTPWQDRLLRLPPFLRPGDTTRLPPSSDELVDGFALTGFFLTRYVFEPRDAMLPQARSSFLAAIKELAPEGGGL